MLCNTGILKFRENIRNLTLRLLLLEIILWLCTVNVNVQLANKTVHQVIICALQ